MSYSETWLLTLRDGSLVEVEAPAGYSGAQAIRFAGLRLDQVQFSERVSPWS